MLQFATLPVVDIGMFVATAQPVTALLQYVEVPTVAVHAPDTHASAVNCVTV
jgi:hypothetical protein